MVAQRRRVTRVSPPTPSDPRQPTAPRGHCLQPDDATSGRAADGTDTRWVVFSLPRTTLRLLLVGIAAYALTLVGLELSGQRDLVRQICNDVVGPSRAYALNTSLCAGLLGGAALLLLFAASVAEAAHDRRYFRLQAAVFAYLALDDRFLLHETLGRVLAIDDALIILTLGVLQLVLLATLARLRSRSAAARSCLWGAGAAFAVMVAADFWDERLAAWPRLSIEDGAKAWGAGLLLGYAWELAAQVARRPAHGAGAA